MVELHGGPWDGKRMTLKGNFTKLYAAEHLRWCNDVITHEYDAVTGEYKGIAQDNGLPVVTLHGGPADGKSADNRAARILVPELVSWGTHPFIKHEYNTRTGQYIGIRLDEPYTYWTVDPFPRLTRIRATLRRWSTRRLRLQITDEDDRWDDD